MRDPPDAPDPDAAAPSGARPSAAAKLEIGTLEATLPPLAPERTPPPEQPGRSAVLETTPEPGDPT